MAENRLAPTARGFFAPERFEANIYDCEIRGSIPKDMNGVFVRVGTEWFYPPNYKDDSVFNADGFVIVPDDSEGFAAGSEVEVWLYA